MKTRTKVITDLATALSAFYSFAFLVGLILSLVIGGCATLPGQPEGKQFIFYNNTEYVVNYQIYCIDHPYKHGGEITVMKGTLNPQDYVDVTVDYGFGRYKIGLQLNKQEFIIPIRTSNIVERILINDAKGGVGFSIEEKLEIFRKGEKKHKKKQILKGFKSKG